MGAQDGAGAWNTANSNWYNGGVNVLWPNTAADTAVFGAGAAGAYAVTVGTVNAGGITFNQSGYTLGSGTINIPTAGFTFASSGGSTNTVTSAVVGASNPQVTKTGAGTLILGGLTASAGTPLLTITGGTFNGTTGAFDSTVQLVNGVSRSQHGPLFV